MQITCIMCILFTFDILCFICTLFFCMILLFYCFIFALAERSTNCRSSGRQADRWEGEDRGFGTGINRTLFVYTLLSVQLKECVSFIFFISLSLFLCLIFDVLRLVFSQSQRKLCAMYMFGTGQFDILAP